MLCLTLLPSSAAPALAILTDAVGAPLDAPLLGLRQRDVSVVLMLCLDGSLGGGGRGSEAPWWIDRRPRVWPLCGYGLAGAW